MESKEKKSKKGVALITGASAGLGLELSKLLAHDGYNLVVVARDKKRLDKLAGYLKQQYGVQAKVIAKDLTKLQAAQEVYDELAAASMHVDILINNAGFNEYGRFIETDLAKELQIIALNVAGYTQMVKLFLPAMLKKGSGRIMNVGSVGSFMPGPINAVYCAAKAYVLSFSEALVEELIGTGVTVTALCPGAILTEFPKRAGIADVRVFQSKITAADPQMVAKSGYNALMKGKAVIVPGVLNKIAVASLRVTPRCCVRKASKIGMSRNAN